MLKNKKIALFVTGGIAVYKAADLTRKLIKKGATVKVGMTASAMEFVTPLTFQVLSKSDVYTDTFDEKVADEVAHIHLADWADIVLVAPATANILAKMANGIADDFVSTTLLAATGHKFVAPAMNVHMYENPATVRNLSQLQKDGIYVIEPETGFLAEGYSGKGRLPEPDTIVEILEEELTKREVGQPLKGKKLLVTAGGTKERIDPVRFLSNDSSGKMGYALAAEAHRLGAVVTLVSATKHLPAPHDTEVIYVESAKEMEHAVLEKFDSQDIVVMAAAVSDYRPAEISPEKIKKDNPELVLNLEKTNDILATLGHQKKQQYVIGFAAETTNLEAYAKGKLSKKKANMIVANDVSQPHAGFDKDTNEVVIFTDDGERFESEVASKNQIAQEILKVALKKMK